MAWHDDPTHPFAGIAEKLKRADRNIVNLKSEIDTFINSGEYPTIPHPDDKMWQQAVNYHKTKRIPLLFGVLAGEIIHHLRSSLDHVAWHFSSDEARRTPHDIEFPIFEKEPRREKEIERYNRKVQGITKPRVLACIKDMQPYKAGADVCNDSLLIVHNMDRFDKHRELVIVDSSVVVEVPSTMPDLANKFRLYTEGKLPQSEIIAASRAMKEHGKATPDVAFRQFGQRKTQSVIPGLVQLFDEVSTLVGVFATEV
jgi:hypothetical protein